MAEITLGRLLRKDNKRVIESLLGIMDEPLAVFDIDGSCLLGDDPGQNHRDLSNLPLIHNGQQIGWMVGLQGSKKLPVIKSIVEASIRQEFEKRSLATEVLEKYRELHLLYRLSERLIATPYPEMIGQMALNEICTLVQAAGGVISLASGETAGSEILARYGLPYQLTDWFLGSGSLIDQVLQSGTGKLWNNVPVSGYFQGNGAEVFSLLCAPLKVEDRSFGVMIIIGDQNKEFTAGDLKLVNTIALQTAPAIEIALLHQKDLENARIERDLQTAYKVQSSMLPSRMPHFKGWHLASFWQPARIVSGDLYDFIRFSGGKLGVVVGDVTDKGVPAALLMANARSVLRGVAAAAGRSGVISPGKILARTNDVLSEDMPMDMFVTCLLVIIDRRTGHVRYANAGHNPPYLHRENQAIELRATGLPLGIYSNIQYEEKEAWLEPGDSLLLYSDGIVEAHNREGDMFGFPRLSELLSPSSGSQHFEGEALIQFLMSQLDEFTGPGWEQEDDITIVTAKRMEVEPIVNSTNSI